MSEDSNHEIKVLSAAFWIVKVLELIYTYTIHICPW